MKIRTAFLAALATLPLLAGGASAHGGWGDRGHGHGNPEAAYWREREARHAWFEARRAREWERQRRQAWEHQQRYAAPRPGYYQGGGWGPRW